jgi:hypothetical protein
MPRVTVWSEFTKTGPQAGLWTRAYWFDARATNMALLTVLFHTAVKEVGDWCQTLRRFILLCSKALARGPECTQNPSHGSSGVEFPQPVRYIR